MSGVYGIDVLKQVDKALGALTDDDIIDSVSEEICLYIEHQAIASGETTDKREQERRFDAVCKFTGLTRKQVLALLQRRIEAIERQRDGLTHRVEEIDQEIKEKLALVGRGLTSTLDKATQPHKPLVGVVPHWQTALDMQYDAVQMLQRLIAGGGVVHFEKGSGIPLQRLHFDEEVQQLRRAEAYSFNTETMTAITQAAESIPHDAPLSSTETPNTGTGWFWFAEPMTSPPVNGVTPTVVNGLLWGWTDFGGKPAIRFSTYNITEKNGERHCLPFTRWHWPVDLSFHDMIGLAHLEHNRLYGPGGKLENFSSKDETIAIIGHLSLFFLMACVWFKQRVPVLTREPGHIERHARKRFQREHKLDEAPKVQVVALRRALRDSQDSAHPEVTVDQRAREYSVRWIVSGHTRLQACGPAHADRKLIWVEAYPKGPENKPLKVKTKVYAVVR